jgi:DNA replication protein DnaC
MSDNENMLLNSNLKQLRLPTIKAEYEKLAKEAADQNATYQQFLLKLTELEIAARSDNALKNRIKQAMFPVDRDLEGYDFTAIPSLSKQKILELGRCKWLDSHENCCLIGTTGTGKTHLAVALGLAACQAGRKVKFYTASALVNRLEEMQEKYLLEKFLAQLDRVDLLVCDELGYLTFSRKGAELLFQVFADRYERGSMLITSNLPFSEWGQVFQGERMTAALLDRLTHHCHIFEMNGESYRFKQSAGKRKKPNAEN